MVNPRYTLCTIVTADHATVELMETVRKATKATHEEIYIAGLEHFKKIAENNHLVKSKKNV